MGQSSKSSSAPAYGQALSSVEKYVDSVVKARKVHPSIQDLINSASQKYGGTKHDPIPTRLSSPDNVPESATKRPKFDNALSPVDTESSLVELEKELAKHEGMAQALRIRIQKTLIERDRIQTRTILHRKIVEHLTQNLNLDDQAVDAEVIATQLITEGFSEFSTIEATDIRMFRLEPPLSIALCKSIAQCMRLFVDQ